MITQEPPGGKAGLLHPGRNGYRDYSAADVLLRQISPLRHRGASVFCW